MGPLLQALLSAVVLLKDRREEGMEGAADAGFLRTKNTNQEAVPNRDSAKERKKSSKGKVFASLLP